MYVDSDWQICTYKAENEARAFTKAKYSAPLKNFAVYTVPHTCILYVYKPS